MTHQHLLLLVQRGDSTPHDLAISILNNFELRPNGGNQIIDFLESLSAEQLELAFEDSITVARHQLESLTTL